MNMSGLAGGFYWKQSRSRSRNIKRISRGKKSSNCPIIPSSGTTVSHDMRAD